MEATSLSRFGTNNNMHSRAQGTEGSGSLEDEHTHINVPHSHACMKDMLDKKLVKEARYLFARVHAV